MRNPPAFDQILIDNYEALESKVDPAWLPLPVLVASKAAQHVEMRRKHLKSAEDWAAHLRKQGNHLEADDYLERTKRHSEEEIAKMLKQKQWRQGFTEYGSGHYGTIYPTQTKGIVCKITTDASEAQFVINAISIGKWPQGIVKYYAILRLPHKFKNRPVFILWRDEVEPPALAATKMGYSEKFCDMLHAAKEMASHVRLAVKRQKVYPYKQIAAAMEAQSHSDVPEYLQPEFSVWKTYSKTSAWLFRMNNLRPRLTSKLTILLYGFRTCCESMRMSYGFAPGAALDFYMENGMLLADVHGNNVMQHTDRYGDHEWLISDPGHMIALDTRFQHVRVPSL